jgi:hypothetical protein
MVNLTLEQKQWVNDFVHNHGGDECDLSLLAELFEQQWSGHFHPVSVGDGVFGFSEDDGIELIEQILVQ